MSYVAAEIERVFAEQSEKAGIASDPLGGKNEKKAEEASGGIGDAGEHDVDLWPREEHPSRSTHVKTLVLVRHGKAVPRKESGDDEMRRLTDAGKRALAATYPETFRLLGDAGDIEVWSSPAMRTFETAQIIVETLGVSNPISCMPLLEGNKEMFFSLLGRSEAKTVIAVGHNPMMEELAEELTGMRLSFSPGAVCAIELDQDGLKKNRLVWFVQGVRTGKWNTLVKLEGKIRESARAVTARMQGFLSDPEDPETLHKLRVSLRSIRSLFMFIEPYQKRSQNAALRSELRRFERETSDLREIDVLIDHIREYGEGEGASLLLQVCRERRDEELERMLVAMSGRKLKEVIPHLIVASTHIRWRDHVEKGGLSASDIKKRFEKLAGEYADECEATDLNDPVATHTLRKSAKAVRYTASNFSDFIGDEAEDTVRNMTRYQDELGELCDARVNRDIIMTFPKKGLSAPAREELERLLALQDTAIVGLLASMGVEPPADQRISALADAASNTVFSAVAGRLYDRVSDRIASAGSGKLHDAISGRAHDAGSDGSAEGTPGGAAGSDDDAPAPAGKAAGAEAGGGRSIGSFVFQSLIEGAAKGEGSEDDADASASDGSDIVQPWNWKHAD